MRVKSLCAVAGFTAALLTLAPRASADAPVKAFHLPDLSEQTSIGLDLQHTWWNTWHTSPGTGSNIINTTMDVFADIEVAPHWLLVARIPFAHTQEERNPRDLSVCCGFVLGNLTLGVRGLFTSVEGQGWRSVVGFDVLLSLATASVEDDPTASAGAKTAAPFAHQTHDPGRYLPNTWTQRLTGHIQLYGARFMLQAEAGLHVFLYDEANDPYDDPYDLAVRLALAAGIRATRELAFVVELNNMVFVGEDDNHEFHFYHAVPHYEDVVTSVDVGLRYRGRAFAFGLHVSVPIDHFLQDLDMLGVGADGSASF